MAEEKKTQVLRVQEGVTPRGGTFGAIVVNPTLEKAIKPGVPEGVQPPKAPPKVYPGQTRETVGQSRPTSSGRSDGSRETSKDQASTKE